MQHCGHGRHHRLRHVKQGDCFVAIAGERFDGQTLWPSLRKGRRLRRREPGCAIRATGLLLRVPDTIPALGDLAPRVPAAVRFRVVAITGSNGKTTTKRMIDHILSQHLRPPGQKSFNNNIGVPLTLLGARAQDDVIVANWGQRSGRDRRPDAIAQPDIAVVTNAHPAHLEGFGDWRQSSARSSRSPTGCRTPAYSLSMAISSRSWRPPASGDGPSAPSADPRAHAIGPSRSSAPARTAPSRSKADRSVCRCRVRATSRTPGRLGGLRPVRPVGGRLRPGGRKPAGRLDAGRDAADRRDDGAQRLL